MDKNYWALELDKILEMVAKETTCEDGEALARSIKPAYTPGEVRRLLEETDAAFVLMAKFGAPSFTGMKNVTNALRRAQAGGGLGLRELLDIGGTLRAIRSLQQWHSKNAGMHTVLSPRFDILAPNKRLEEKIFTCIQSEEEVADAASPALAAIRRKIRGAAVRVREQLDKLIHSQTHQKHLQEAIVTQRSGRYVVPVKAEFRGEVPGLVHDTSASGQTVFVEPMSVVELNNEIRVLRSDEQEEISRILLELSGEAGDFADSLIESYQFAVQLNVIFAKAQLAYRMKAVVPEIDEKGRTDLHSARHPLIAKEKVVPTDIALGQDFDALIITGPNTGGKTVALKTLGLLTLMAMCGLMIPAGEGSRLPVYRHILADIGDEQSIEQSLSTFSAHMVNIIRILDVADGESLVLLDELGAGTDPVEGAALATAIIEELRRKGVRLACTTHYAELKSYALQTDGVENACCEFDVESLRPTYRLLIGVPGKSNAFAISRRLGLEGRIVDRAGELVNEENSSFEQVIERLEERRREMENELEAARKAARQARETMRQSEARQAEAGQRAKREIDQAREEASRIVQKTRQQADALLNELDELRRQQNKALSAEQKARLRSGLRELESSADPVRKRRRDDYQLPRELRPGDSVVIFDIDKAATVLEAPKDGQVLVQAGIIKTRVQVENLRLSGEGQKAKAKPGRSVTKNVSAPEIATSLDLRGMNVEEGLMEVDAFLDRAARSHVPQVTIIHGKGTGVLRAAVQQHLRRCSQVKSFRLGAFGEGESGVTVVEMK
ncbi:endonuclease MutS2 [Neglecta sp. X4]|uniref:endonuclease MutS2 n=1 Tax=unclassified Neglectibacter TaxID=2632164 RepID=UPI001371F61C|nr:MULTISPECIES: endonuclease MutS2 [unclassified Neglectibacter]NBI17332.1 endonuclease MutS2 [Neglectibacter sp. 59]NBJ72781.1 endonuclease MutS2 [Neglectibacter sp. X4]NCE80664.1 endonuclease MutS2 [Neglectibacter sp. X58]